MHQTCRHCQQQFEITEQDLQFYDKVSPVFNGNKYLVPPPTLCPNCRQQRRLAFRNERKLYKQKCGFSGEEIISIYSPDKAFNVYKNDIWWSDQWDPLEYGRDFDFSRPFFEQFQELRTEVPRLALFQKNAENSAHTNHTDSLKDCYICVSVGMSERIYYSKWIIGCTDLTDCYQLEKSQLCYENQHGSENYNCSYLFLSDQCRDSAFLYDCKGCEHCFLCSNLRHKKYCILNKQYSQQEYEQLIAAYDLGSFETMTQCQEEFSELLQTKSLHRNQTLVNCENSNGDFLYNCKNVHSSYNVIDSEDAHYCYDSGHLKDCYDTYEPAFNCELQYDSHACNRGTRTLFGHVSYDVDFVVYVDTCHNSSHLFGCVGVRQKQYCILNKQYTKEEYETLAGKIIEHMKQTEEWGEFFPIETSPFAYPETVAQEYYPLTKNVIIHKGWEWKDEEEFDLSGVTKKIPAQKLPDHIRDIPDDILNWAIVCTQSKRPFKIQKGELEFYRQMNLPIPHLHPDIRHLNRMELRNPRKLWKRQCQKCAKRIESPYSPERTEIVYCEQCYLAEVY